MALYESGENYLETIYELTKRGERVLPVDIARELGFSRPSVTRALKLLAEAGLVVNAPKRIELTELGVKKAEAVFEKHTAITEFLVSHGVTREVAAKDACRLEHYMSEETFDCIKSMMKDANNRPR